MSWFVIIGVPLPWCLLCRGRTDLTGSSATGKMRWPVEWEWVTSTRAEALVFRFVCIMLLLIRSVLISLSLPFGCFQQRLNAAAEKHLPTREKPKRVRRVRGKLLKRALARSHAGCSHPHLYTSAAKNSLSRDAEFNPKSEVGRSKARWANCEPRWRRGIHVKSQRALGFRVGSIIVTHSATRVFVCYTSLNPPPPLPREAIPTLTKMEVETETDRISLSPDDASGGEAKACADCHTTKTPLWRGGPEGPKVRSSLDPSII
jgi:hypothetical protein